MKYANFINLATLVLGVCFAQNTQAQWLQNATTQTITSNTNFNNAPNAVVGIGTANPSNAKLDVQGAIGNTVAMFRKSSSGKGISLVSDWPGVYFNAYFNGTSKSMSSGYGSIVNFDPNIGRMEFGITQNAAGAADANISFPIRMAITKDGNVGIGTTSPQQKLDVNGDARMNQLFLYKDFNGSDGGLTLNGNRPTLRFNSTETNQKWLVHVGTNYNGAFELFNSTDGNWGPAKFSVAPGTGDVRTAQIFVNRGWDGSDGGLTLNGNRPSLRFNSDESNQKWLFHVGYNGVFELYNSTDGNWGTPKLRINPGTGAVAIGTNLMPAGYKLSVGGKVICEELKVQLQGAWPDYVFAPEYELKPLEEVEQHIAEKGHLPNIPPACEMQENGISVGEMQTKMMEKIEELTLYLIALKKENETLQQRVQALETNSR